MMGNFMEKLQMMQVQMEEVKKKLDGMVAEGYSPQEKVKARVNGNRKLLSVEIISELNSFDKEELEDYICLAVQNALEKAEKIHEQEMRGMAGGIIPGMSV